MNTALQKNEREELNLRLLDVLAMFAGIELLIGAEWVANLLGQPEGYHGYRIGVVAPDVLFLPFPVQLILSCMILWLSATPRFRTVAPVVLVIGFAFLLVQTLLWFGTYFSVI